MHYSPNKTRYQRYDWYFLCFGGSEGNPIVKLSEKFHWDFTNTNIIL
ncbi:17382_t:CDS:2, partial [Entrophospora sp. SA101]